ncbi:MAG: JAB domain-containing protein [Elusimicrobiota bacterium]
MQKMGESLHPNSNDNSNIIIVHNHPSGDPTPSEDDIRVTAKLANSCKNVGINLIDHIVIGDTRYATITPNVTGYQTIRCVLP